MRRPMFFSFFLASLASAAYLLVWRLADASAPHPSPEGLAAPLDDAYIFMQYARQALRGEYFHYTPQAPISTGVSSLTYLGALTLVMSLGISGPWAAWVIGALSLFITLAAASQLSRELFPALPKWLAPLFFAAHASLVSAHFQGMDTGLSIACMLSSLCFLATGSARSFWLSLACLAFCRPEGQLASLGLACAWAWLRPSPRWASVSTGLALALVPSLANFALTGSIIPDSARAKLLSLAFPQTGPHAFAALSYFTAKFLQVFNGLSIFSVPMSWDAASPHNPSAVHLPILAVSIAGWGYWQLCRQGSREARAVAVTSSAWWLAAFGLLSWSLASSWHQHRYLLLLFSVVDLGYLAALNALTARRSLPGARLASALLLTLWFGFGALRWPFFLEASLASGSRYASVNREAALALAQLPEAGAVALADAGLLAYYSRRETCDLLGVTDHANALLQPQGLSSVMQRLRSLPADVRPRSAVLHVNRPDLNAEALVAAGLLKDNSPADWPVKEMRLYRFLWEQGGKGR